MLLGEWVTLWAAQHFPSIEPVTARGYAGALDRWVLPWLADHRLDELDRQAVKAWRTDITRDGATPATVNRATTVLGVVLSCAVDDGLIQADPTARLRPLVHRRQEVTPATLHQVEAIRGLITTPGGRLLVSLIAYAGLRPGEAVALTWRDVRPGSVTVRRGGRLAGGTKTGTVRVVPTISPVREDLDAVGPGAPGDRVCGAPDWSNWTRDHWRPARALAGCPRVQPYHLRHTFASLLIAEGRPVHEVARLLGHSTPALTLSTYGHLFDEAQLHDAEDMEAAVVRARGHADRLSGRA